MKRLVVSLLITFILSGAQAADEDQTREAFRLIPGWQYAESVTLSGDKSAFEAADSENGSIIYTQGAFEEAGFLSTHGRYDDQVVSFEYMVPEGSQAGIYVHGRYEIKLGENAGALTGGFNRNINQPFDDVPPIVRAGTEAGQWQKMQIRFRGIRYDDAQNKTANALFLEVKLNDQVVQKDTPIEYYSTGSEKQWEETGGPFGIRGANGPVAIRNFSIHHADYETIVVPEKGEASNIGELVDHVAIGQQTFTALGCIECHTTKKGDTSFKTGPNLFGLFQRNPRKREIMENGGASAFLIDADRDYMKRSIRQPHDELAISEMGANLGQTYLPIMPPFSEELLSDAKIDAIYSYLATLNDASNQGPAEVLVSKGGPKQYFPLEDTMQVLVGERTKIQRGSMKGVSGRSIHVGHPNGINYTFDPRTLAIEKIWQGGFIDGSGEWQGRGGSAFTPGYQSKEISFGNGGSLLAPLDKAGKAIDFSFKEALYQDWATIEASLKSEKDHLKMLAEIDARFLGYTIPSSTPDASPTFEYSIGKNRVSVETTISADGSTKIQFTAKMPKAQSFSLNAELLQNPKVSAGSIDGNGIWHVPAGTKTFTLKAKMRVASKVWRPEPSDFAYHSQPLDIQATEAELPKGYSSEQYLPPKDNYGRKLLFEATGLDLAPDGTIVVGTRTSGIWRIVDGKWIPFADGLFDCLGLVVEDEKGLQIVVGQKPELTRITDTDGDGFGDKFETLSDQFSYHSNYHSYMHGPVRDAEGNYYYNLNLLHTDEAIYKGSGLYMGTSGGFSGWTIKVTPEGEFIPWANGLRSPAGLAIAPDGRLWYSENQGEYVGTSKLFVLEEGGFYGHPAGLIDLPGTTQDSPEIQWPGIGKGKKRAVALFPHNSVANSPGNPTWDTTGGKFGPFEGQLFIGDQTQSKLIRVSTEVVNGIEQGCSIPFAKSLQSGIMRPVFLPDGSLLLGQTGRGWQAHGGQVASLQRIIWDGHTIAPAIHSVNATESGFAIKLTQAISKDVTDEQLRSISRVKSWVYRDAPDYGSPELNTVDESVATARLNKERTILTIELASSAKESIAFQTARVYHIVLDSKSAFEDDAPDKLEAYYSRY